MPAAAPDSAWAAIALTLERNAMRSRELRRRTSMRRKHSRSAPRVHGARRRSRLAKKATRKATRKPRKATRKTAARKSAPRRATRTVARKKTAARSAATRRRKQQPAPPRASKVAAVTTAVRGRIAGAVAAVARTLRRGDAGLDAIQLLEAEHRRFERMLKQGEETTERARKGRRELLATLTAELNIHELMEERVLYPALQAHPEARDVVLEGYEEHHVADLIVEELHQVATDDEAWAAKFKVL